MVMQNIINQSLTSMKKVSIGWLLNLPYDPATINEKEFNL